MSRIIQRSHVCIPLSHGLWDGWGQFQNKVLLGSNKSPYLHRKIIFVNPTLHEGPGGEEGQTMFVNLTHYGGCSQFTKYFLLDIRLDF